RRWAASAIRRRIGVRSGRRRCLITSTNSRPAESVDLPIDRDATLKIADDFLRDGRVDDAAACVELAVDEYVIAGRFTDAATLLQDFLVRVPGRMPTLLRLVEVCRDGGLEGAMYDAQALLADAYLAAGQAGEALVIAEDLIAREPDREDHRVRLA